MKKSFSLLEIIFVISILGFLYTFFIPKNKINKINDATNKLTLYLKQTRFQAMTDNQYSATDSYWHKKRWTFKFFRCRQGVGGIYYTIYSDKNKSGHPSASDSLSDSLTNKKIYNNNHCKYNEKYSKYVLLTKEFDIQSINISCNNTDSLGQLSFGSDGKIYTKLSSIKNDFYEYELKEECKIVLIDTNEQERVINIEPNTGFITKQN